MPPPRKGDDTPDHQREETSAMADDTVSAPPRLGKTGPRPKPEIERFLKYVQKGGGPDGECWIWTGHTMTAGYGNFLVGSRTDFSRKKIGAHIWAYRHFRGPYPDGYELDHGSHCRTKICVNPFHMTPRAPADHIRQPDSTAGMAMARTHCPAGHEYALRNTRVKSNGWRSCRTCENEHRRRRPLIIEC